MRSTLGTYHGYSRLLGARVVKPKLRGTRDTTNFRGCPYRGLFSVLDALDEQGCHSYTVYRVWYNSWQIIATTAEGERVWVL